MNISKFDPYHSYRYSLISLNLLSLIYSSIITTSWNCQCDYFFIYYRSNREKIELILFFNLSIIIIIIYYYL